MQNHSNKVIPSSLLPLCRGAFLFLGLLVLGGCGSGGAANSLSGKVTLNGNPVGGTLTFSGGGKEVGPVPINPDGTYKVENLPVGEVNIIVKGFPGVGVGMPTAPPPAIKGMEMPTGAAKMGVAPPARYAAPGNGLTVTVKGGKQTHDIVLNP